MAIKTFGNSRTKKVFAGEFVPELAADVCSRAYLRLHLINAAANIMALRLPPSNRLEKLRGNLKEWYSIRINRQWRIIFKWNGNDAFDVMIVDYH